jgi:ketosteroid isomerase-like protein
MSEAREHPNATRIRGLFRAFRERDLETISASFHTDAVWRFPGRDGKLAGEHRGVDAIFEFLADVSRLTDDSFHLEVEDVLANDERAVVLFTGSGKRAGRTLDNPTCLVIRFEEEKAVELREFVWDLRHVDEFWS